MVAAMREFGQLETHEGGGASRTGGSARDRAAEHKTHRKAVASEEGERTVVGFSSNEAAAGVSSALHDSRPAAQLRAIHVRKHSLLSLATTSSPPSPTPPPTTTTSSMLLLQLPPNPTRTSGMAPVSRARVFHASSSAASIQWEEVFAILVVVVVIEEGEMGEVRWDETASVIDSGGWKQSSSPASSSRKGWTGSPSSAIYSGGGFEEAKSTKVGDMCAPHF